MTKGPVVLFCVVLGSGWLCAQVNLLTVREAESIVERVPAVAAAKKLGECPLSSPTYWGVDTLAIQVRRQCGPDGGTLINVYEVNRRTGSVTEGGDSPRPAADAAGEAFGRQLVQQAQQRVLSTAEARCLALAAARGLPGWNEAGASLSAESLSQRQPGRVGFEIRHTAAAAPTESGRNLSVDLTTAHVRDDESGLELMSRELGALTSKILALREPLWLTDEDVLSIALQIPSVLAELGEGCRVSPGAPFRSDETEVGLVCNGQQNEGGIVVAVNVRTGRATNARSGEALETAGTAQMAGRLLEERQRRRGEIQDEVRKACGLSGSR